MGKGPGVRLDDLFPFVPMNPDESGYEVSWIARGLVMENKINVLFGAEKSGKSRLLAWLLVHLLSGRSVFGKPVKDPGRILYLAGEETRQEVTSRLVEYQEELDIPDDEIQWSDKISFCDAAGMRLDHRHQRKWLRDRIASGDFDMFLVDPLRRVHGASEGSNDEMSVILNDLREWSNRYRMTQLLVHHTGKLGVDDDESRIATWSRGATDLPAVLDWAMYAKRIVSAGPYDRVRLIRKGRAPKKGELLLQDRGERFRLVKG